MCKISRSKKATIFYTILYFYEAFLVKKFCKISTFEAMQISSSLEIIFLQFWNMY